ncbi:DUF2507 domain-containing protein [Aliibacillus thermotolerans]|uniref:DUF2507 domain-containing protein n=1 Tax=Aliibacillus thermotolerans TaxID=1834418 RepID=A0ABW0U7Y1_9BACI|nr:DUF2507 domain-containing protein [Aliibacillus thermotolerans]MDA3128960.1 DUF2507 domain-containing protein [Aliibacillus thermotolerans]
MELKEKFGIQLLRTVLLPELLGKEESDLLYWGGKVIARQYPADSLEDILLFFKKADWGELHIVKKKKREIHFQMKQQSPPLDYHLEAGYLAEQIERLEGKAAETYIHKKAKHISFIVQWDT